MNIRILAVLLLLGFSSTFFGMTQGPEQFDAEFAQALADINELAAVGREFDAACDKENAMLVMQGISNLQKSLEDELIKHSANKWFLTGSLLEKKLLLSGLTAIQTDSGLCVPHSVQTRTPLHHLVSHHQIFSSCGFNTLANAYALERQAKDGLPITAERTRKYAEFCFACTLTRSQPFIKLLFDGGINAAHSEEFSAAADDILKNYAVPLHLIYLSTPELPSFEDETTKIPIIELIKSNPAVHFGFNAGGHWVLFSIIRQRGYYLIYYLNSANDPIDVGLMGPVVAYLDGLAQSAIRQATSNK